jgi:MFS family permease
VALAGFTAFYGLERLPDRSSPRNEQAATGARSGVPADHHPGVGVYRLHLGSFLVYDALMTYTMALRLRTGIAFAVLFTVAMGLHFVLTDRGLEEHYPHRFRRSGRALLAGALLVGWLLSALFAPSSTLLVALLIALLSGSILLNVFKEEIPSGRRSSFPWFLVGLVLYAALLATVTALSE